MCPRHDQFIVPSMAIRVVDRAIQSFGAEGISQDTFLAGAAAGSARPYVFALFRAKDGALWYGTSDGLYKTLPGAAAALVKVEAISFQVTSIHDDGRGYLWLAGRAPGVTRFRIEETKGVLFLDQLRRKLGDDKFLTLMSDYFAANTTKTVTAQSFPVAFEFTEPADGPAYSVSDMRGRLGTAVIVYGTQREAGANRYAAEQLQAAYLNQFESIVPIYKDFEVSDDLLAHKDVVFIGRPESNNALAGWSQKLGLDYEAAVFKVENHTYAGEREALAWAAKNPQDAGHMVLVLAGNDALRTVKLATAQRFDQTPYVVTGAAAVDPGAARPGRRPR